MKWQVEKAGYYLSWLDPARFLPACGSVVWAAAEPLDGRKRVGALFLLAHSCVYIRFSANPRNSIPHFPVIVSMKLRYLLAWGLVFWGIAPASGAEGPISPVSVCEVLQDLDSFAGKVVALLGRYSVRQNGRWVSEDQCSHPVATEGYTWPAVIWLTQDSKEAPVLPNPIEFNEPILYRKLQQMHQHTSLVAFRFGNPDYDRWSIVYGRIETVTPLKKSAGFGKIGAPAQIFFRGDGAIFFFSDK